MIGRQARRLVTRFHRSPDPFFLYFSALAPHHGAPVEADDPGTVLRSNGKVTEFVDPARPAWVKGRFDAVVTRAPGLPAGGGVAERRMRDKPRTMWAPEPNRAERRAMRDVTRQRAEALFVLDRQVARLVGRLKRVGEYRDTVIVFTSDNGYLLGEQRKRQGQVLPHEPSLRVPLVVAGPGIRHGVRFDPATTVDLSATLADLAGARRWMPYAGDGASLVPTIYRGDRGWRRPVLTEGLVWGPAYRNARTAHRSGFDDARTTIGLRTPRYKYIAYSSGEEELYDLDRDPNELRSVVRLPEYRRVLTRLRRVWSRTKGCAAAECRAALPHGLARGPDALRSGTRRQLRGVAQRHSYRR